MLLTFTSACAEDFFPLINNTHLPHGYQKTTLSFHQLFFLPSPCCFFFSWRQTQLLQWKEGQPESPFVGRVSGIFARQKTQLSLHMNLQSSAAKGKICHNLLPDRNIERRREKTCWGLSGAGARVVSSLWDSLSDLLPREEAGWQPGRLRQAAARP